MDVVGMDSAVKLAKALPAPHNMQISAGLVIDMADEIARLRDEADALRVDAERYRFVRGLFGYDGHGVFVPCGTRRERDQLAKETDAAIDAARGKDNG